MGRGRAQRPRSEQTLAPLRHASFFSGVGGIDLGFLAAGMQTVSHSETNKFASAVLATHWPTIPNLGDIVELNRLDAAGTYEGSTDWRHAEVWSGGFPCQDLSVAGRRKGFGAGERSVLAFTFLDLVERWRPRWFVLENVPGLLTSNEGRDFGRLADEVVGLGYGFAWRTLDARWFGVPQRRRRVFLVAAHNDAFDDLGAERAAEVLFECTGGCGHIAPGGESREGAPEAPATGPDQDRRGQATDAGRGAAIDPSRVRTADGLAGRLDDPRQRTLEPEAQATPEGLTTTRGSGPTTLFRQGSFGAYREVEVAGTLRASGGDFGGGTENYVIPDTFGADLHRSLQARDWKGGISNQDIGAPGYLVGYQTRTDERGGSFSLTEAEVANSLSALWPGDTSHRSMTLVAGGGSGDANPTSTAGGSGAVDLLPAELDAHRYRCCGNGVASGVAEWIGRRLVAVDARWQPKSTRD